MKSKNGPFPIQLSSTSLRPLHQDFFPIGNWPKWLHLAYWAEIYKFIPGHSWNLSIQAEDNPGGHLECISESSCDSMQWKLHLEFLICLIDNWRISVLSTIKLQFVCPPISKLDTCNNQINNECHKYGIRRTSQIILSKKVLSQHGNILVPVACAFPWLEWN